MTLPFRKLAEEVLIGAAELQSQFDQRSVDLDLVLERLGQELSIDKRLQLVEYLRNQGWVDSSDSTLKSLRLRVTGEGQIEAERLYKATAPMPEVPRDTAEQTGRSLSSKKIELAVLYELFGFAEDNQKAPTPQDIADSFAGAKISLRRVEIALADLEKLGHAESLPDPSTGVYRWQIAGDGFGVVDRALRVPVSFIARLAANGTEWLATEDAKRAVLRKLNKSDDVAIPEPAPEVRETPVVPPINITNTFAPTNTFPPTSSIPVEKSGGIDWPGWANALIALAVGAGGIFATLWVAGKL